jgi:bifunctional DNase/RNase
MKKLKLDIVGLSYSQTQSGAYALVLGEAKGKRRLPIIIGGFEAQAIAIELEKMTPSRPLTHDLFKSFADAFTITVKEVIIYNLVEGIFFAKLICDNGEKEVEIDTRTSDAIAIAVRFQCPIFTYEFILSSAGIILEDENATGETTVESTMEEPELAEKAEEETDIRKKSTEELKELLKKALDDEQYERASQIRDEINNRKKS